MTREDMTPEAYAALLDSITDILVKNGLKATTMDSIASSLKMSKRTLYEIFSSKNEMVSEALNNLHRQLSEANKSIVKNSTNSMEAVLNCFLNHRDMMKKVNLEFYREIASFMHARAKPTTIQKAYIDNLLDILKRGARQGVFRDDVNFMVQCKMMGIQMESLKRMEELFPPDITLLEVYDSIGIGFLRAIATPKGMKMLDDILAKIKK